METVIANDRVIEHDDVRNMLSLDAETIDYLESRQNNKNRFFYMFWFSPHADCPSPKWQGKSGLGDDFVMQTDTYSQQSTRRCIKSVNMKIRF